MQLEHNIKHRFFDKNASGNYRLSLLIGANELSYAIYDVQDDTAVLMRSFTSSSDEPQAKVSLRQLLNLLESEELIHNRYASTSVAIRRSPVSIVPVDLFDVYQMNTFYQFDQRISRDDLKLQFDNLAAGGFVNVYGVNKELIRWLDSNIGQYTLKHASTYMLRSILGRGESSGKETVFVHVANKSVQISVIENKGLLIHNNYAFQTDEDVLYHLLNVCRQLDIDPKQHPFVLTGSFKDKGNLYRLLNRYIYDLRLGVRPIGKQYCTELDQLPEYQQFDLLCI